MVKQILIQYEHKFSDPPLGKRFDECYDLDTIQPAQEYLDLYEQIKEKLTKFGLDYSLLL
jgi:methylamine--corrinoid protein Co-methyltransferase